MSQSSEVQAGLERLTNGLGTLVEHKPVMVGIHTGGAWIAERLHRALALPDALSTVNISFYRDDFTRIGCTPVSGRRISAAP